MPQDPKDTRNGNSTPGYKNPFAKEPDFRPDVRTPGAQWFEELPLRYWISECTNCERIVLTDKKANFGKCPICIYGILHFRLVVDAKFREVTYLSDEQSDAKLEQALEELAQKDHESA